MKMDVELTILFDGGCPLCLREVNFLEHRDQGKKIEFVDVNEITYSRSNFKTSRISKPWNEYRAQRWSSDHGCSRISRSLPTINLGWIYRPTTWPIIGSFVDWLTTFGPQIGSDYRKASLSSYAMTDVKFIMKRPKKNSTINWH